MNTSPAQNISTKLVIFDLDGTLLDTITDLGIATNHALAANNLPRHPLDKYPSMVGNGVRALVSRAIPEHLLSDATVDTVLKAFYEYYDAHLTDFTETYPGIHRLLNTLQQKHVALAVASNKYQSAVQRIIARKFPEVKWISVLGNIDERPRKPHPAIVDAILAESGFNRDETLYVGDSEVDIDTARNAGVRCASVSWGFRSASALASHGVTVIVDSPDQIVALL